MRISGDARLPYAQKAFQVYALSCASIGLQYHSVEELFNNTHAWDIELDKNILTAFAAYRMTPRGLKTMFGIPFSSLDN